MLTGNPTRHHPAPHPRSADGKVQRASQWARASQWGLCGILGLSAAAKLLTPYEEAYVVPESLYYIGALVELAAAVALHTRYRGLAIATAVLIALAGIVLAIAVPGETCGCFGGLLRIEGRYHVLLSGVLGALACMSCWTPSRTPEAPVPASVGPLRG